MSLSDKIYREFGGHLYKEDVKQSLKVLTDFCEIHKGTLIVADTFLDIIKEEFGEELLEEQSKWIVQKIEWNQQEMII